MPFCLVAAFMVSFKPFPDYAILDRLLLSIVFSVAKDPALTGCNDGIQPVREE